FDARVENGATQISWKLVGHLTVDQYELLKSNDGIHFSSLAVLDANDKYASYQFTDDQEWEGAYYRIHMQSSIRRPLYSKIIYVQHQTGMTAAAGGRPFSIYPNPSNAEIRIILPENTSGMLRLEIRNQQGGLHGLKRVTAAPGQPLILTRPPNCPPGLYGIL